MSMNEISKKLEECIDNNVPESLKMLFDERNKLFQVKKLKN